jgi:1-acyl-sn-glycerol-3-phosphate acyltransferase
MKARSAMRLAIRLLRLAEIVLVAGGDFFLHRIFHGGPPDRSWRARWLHRHARRALKILDLAPRLSGPVPTRGLLVSNHLGYLDVVVMAAITPAIFVSKSEVKRWPVFGQLAQMAGTLFVDRERRTQVPRINQTIQAALDEGALVVLFPEGTSSNGEEVLPFRSALLEPAARGAHPLFAAGVRYALDDGDVRREVCYWGNHTFVPHLLNLLTKQKVRAAVQFAPVTSPPTDRKELARRLREEVLRLKAAGPP